MEKRDLSRLKIDQEGPQASAEDRGRRRRVWIIPAAVAVAAVFVFLAWSGYLRPAVEVHVAKVSQTLPSKALTVLNAAGYVVAQRKAAVASKATGRLQELRVEEGKVVKEDDVLAVLENKDLEATLQEARAALRVATFALKNAEAELQEATLNYNRIKSLRESGAVSEQAYDVAEARFKRGAALERSAQYGVQRAEASVKVAEINLEYSFIRAPFDGVVLTKNADVGEVVAPFGGSVNAKAAVVTMADMSSLMVEVDVSESSLEKVKVGAAAEIRLDALPNDRFPGRVHMIVPTADRAKATVLTKVKFNSLDPRVLPDMSAKVAFLERPLGENEHKPFLGIPLSAIKTSDKREIVFRVNDQVAHSVPITTGRRWGDEVEVLSGLGEGDRIAVNPGPGVADGRRVKVKE
jgi:RND family efflux transporter MFP subunit